MANHPAELVEAAHRAGFSCPDEYLAWLAADADDIAVAQLEYERENTDDGYYQPEKERPFDY